jgi:hypothetical protein
MWMESSVNIIIAVIACEALVQLWFHAAPLQPIKNLLIRITPFLYSKEQSTHLLNCRYCTSVWVSLLLVTAYFTISFKVFLFIAMVLAVHRLSNFLHLVFSYLRDKQFDLRVARSSKTTITKTVL